MLSIHSTVFCSCVISLPHFQPLILPCKFPSFVLQHPFSPPHNNAPRWVTPSVGGWYLLCTVVCVMGLYTRTLICDL
ncbi:hypothetical protein Nmel_001581 [Mimus melanotis]